MVKLQMREGVGQERHIIGEDVDEGINDDGKAVEAPESRERAQLLYRRNFRHSVARRTN
jgi:hypothetical protein